ncbi:MAG: FAD-dependent thymidylate synthase [Thermoanaerobacteraceae bacterium]|nr:FAD-dependent thymidylate synthase [Thermoanaerobacteraceae bacterium]
MLMTKLTKEQENLLKRFVTNIYGPVYFIHSLPEFIIPPINSKVSRKDTSWRLNIIESLTDGDLDINEFISSGEPSMEAAIDKAKLFHEKWVEKFGHSSIAEQHLMHLCVEDISRYLSAYIELINKRPSFIEWSQRYQKPTRDKVIIPNELKNYSDLKDKYLKTWNISYDMYEQLVEKLVTYLSNTVEKEKNESERKYQDRISKIAFEDARYALLLSTRTSFAVALNALDLLDILRKLLAHKTEEANTIAQKIIEEAEKISPSMMRHVRPSEYQKKVESRLVEIAGRLITETDNVKDDVVLVDYTGRDNGIKMEDVLIMHILFSYSGKSIEAIKKTVSRLTIEEKSNIINKAFEDINQFDHLIEPFRSIRFKFQLCISEANWHQLLRHRTINFNVYEPTIKNGYTVPPSIEKAGCVDLLENAIRASELLYEELNEKIPEAAPYAVTNAHKRLVLMDTDLWAFDHFANLRCTPEAQWDIRNTAYKMLDLIKEICPEFSRFLARRKQA